VVEAFGGNSNDCSRTDSQVDVIIAFALPS
jgi:hypothetical protein